MNFFRNIAKNGPSMEMEVHNVDLSIVNALRRIILAEIPTVALAFDPIAESNEDIMISLNNSALHNEFLAHRISLIPMHFNKKEIAAFNPEDYLFHLKVKNTGTDIIPVTTRNIVIKDAEGKPYSDSVHRRVFPADPITKDHILITKLRPNIYSPEKGESIDITFKASKNIAKNHSRWCPVSCCAFYNMVDEKAATQGLEDKLAEEAKNRNRPLTQEETDKISKRFDTLMKYRFFYKNKYGEPSIFHFKIDSECGLHPEELFTQALDTLIAKLNTFAEECASPTTSITVNKVNATLHDVVIENEDFTLLNVLQSILYNTLIRDQKTNKVLEYIGYHQPHPLDNKMVLKMKFADESVGALEFLGNSVADHVIPYVQNIKDQWV